jgi:ABC-type molybdate transport system substrate-binding protein
VAVVKHSTQVAQAQAFIDYLQGADAQALLRQHGFQAP